MSARLAVMAFIIVPTLMVIALRRPLWGVYATMVMYYFRPDIWDQPSWWQPVLWITCCTIVGWAFQAKDLRIPPPLIAAAMMILAMLVSSMSAWKDRDVSIDATIIIIKLVTVQFLIIQLIRNFDQLKAFLWWNIIGNLWTLKSVFIITLTGGDASRANVGAAQGGGANYLAMSFVMGLPLLYYRYLHGSKRERKAAMILAPFYIFCIIGTGSRGGFLTLFAIFMFMMIRTKRKALGAGLTVVMVLAFAVMVPQEKWERFMTVFRSEEDRGFASQSRIELWRAGIKMFGQSPVTGVGHDNYQLLSARYVGFFAGDTPLEYKPHLDGQKGYNGYVAHSTWVQMMADGGLIGMLPFTLIFIMVFSALYRVRRVKLLPGDQIEVYTASQILEATLWAFCIASTFGSHFKIDFLWWYFGSVSALVYITRQKHLEYRRAVANSQRPSIHGNQDSGPNQPAVALRS